MNTEEKKINYKFPKTLGKCLERLAALRADTAKLAAQMKPLTDEEAALRAYLLETFKKDELRGASGSGLSLLIVTTTVPSLSDWESFWAFAKKKGNEDLVQHSVNTPAWRERLEAKKPVPGVVPFDQVSLRVNKVKKE